MFGDQALKLIIESKSAEQTGAFKPYSDELVRLIVLETRQLQTHITNLLSEAAANGISADAVDQDPGLAAQLVTHHVAAQRNKRCLLAYHAHRLEALKTRLWAQGGSLGLTLDAAADVAGASGGDNSVAAAERGSTLRSRLSTNEMAWLRSYATLLTAYKTDFLDTLDVTAPLGQSSAPRSVGGGGGGTDNSQNGQNGPLADSRTTFDFGPPTELMVTVLATMDAREVQTERGSLNLRRGERMRVRREEVQGLITRGWLVVVDE